MIVLKILGYLSAPLLPLKVHVWESKEGHHQDLDHQFPLGCPLVPGHQGQLPHLQQRDAGGVRLVQRPLQRGEHWQCLPHGLLNTHLLRPPSGDCHSPVHQVRNMILLPSHFSEVSLNTAVKLIKFNEFSFNSN